MKKKWLLIFIAFMLVPFHTYAGTNHSLADAAIGQMVEVKELENTSGEFYKLGEYHYDVTSDKTIDTIYVVGEKQSANQLMASNFKIIVQSKTSDKLQIANLGDMKGYPPTLSFGDVTGDGVNEVLVSIPLGNTNSAQIYTLLSLQKGTFRQLLKPKDFTESFPIQGELKDNFILEISGKQLPFHVPVSIMGEKQSYIQEGFYNEKGTLLQKATYTTDQAQQVRLNKETSQSYCHLIASEVMTGFSEAIVLVTIEKTFRYKNGRLILEDVSVKNRIYKAK